MNSLFRYIESNLPSDLDAALLSDIGHVSHAQLYRDFYNLTGHTVKEYVRKRRLSNALALIKTSDFDFSDIAYQCGYSSHQALCRAVGKTLGITPSDYRRGNTYYFFPPFCGNPVQSVTISVETIPRTLRMKFFHSSLNRIETTAVHAFLRACPNYNGRIFGRNGRQEGNQFCYELYLTDFRSEYETLKSCGFKRAKDIPSVNSVFAVSTVGNDERKINAAWDYLFAEWLQNSMFEYADEPYFEEYLLKNGRPARLKLYLPIRKRGEDTRISLIGNPVCVSS